MREKRATVVKMLETFYNEKKLNYQNSTPPKPNPPVRCVNLYRRMKTKLFFVNNAEHTQ